jgi:uncharacterized protein (TIGR03000 family)
MIHKGLKVVLFAGAVLAAIGMFAPAANAGWWWGAAPAYSGCDSCGFSGCGGCGGHHCCHRSCYGGCWSAYSPCCGSCYSSWTPCGCSSCGWTTSVSSCGCGGMTGTTSAPGIPEMAPKSGSAPTPAPAPPTTPGVTTPSSTGSAPIPPVTPPTGLPALGAPGATEGPGGLLPTPGHGASLEDIRNDGCLLTVWVPYEAQVTINGTQTKSVGSRRQFVSYGLQPGYSYTYQVVAKIMREGKEYTESKTISVTAGDRSGVAFGFNNPPAPPESQTASN